MDELKTCPFCGASANIGYDAKIPIKDGSGLMYEEYDAVMFCSNCPAEIRTTTKHLIAYM